MLGTAVMDAGCSALLAIEPGCAALVSSPVSLLALPPSCAARPLARSLVPSARTACRSSAINVGVGRSLRRVLRCRPHAEHRPKTYFAVVLRFCASTATAERIRRGSGEPDSSPCASSHRLSAFMEVQESSSCFQMLGALVSPRDDDQNGHVPNNP